jgi:carboxyl-terminal processing protease
MPITQRTTTEQKGLVRAAAALIALAAISGCGGGGGGAVAAPSPPPGTSSWTPGVFQTAATFANQCLSRRTGLDPSSGLAYPDAQGTVLTENNWLRSWSNELYLWYDEIVDRDPALFSTDAYFDVLKSPAITASGIPRDRFHFTIPTDEWRQQSQSGVSAGYGVEWAFLATTPPRELVVAFTEPGSPATSAPANLARGARILTVDGIDLVNSIDSAGIAVLNAGISPSQPGESHTFTVQDLGSSSTRTFTMTAATTTSDPVQGVSTIDTATGRIGYMLFNEHIATAEQELIDAIDTFEAAAIDDLVLDLRYNGGGFLFIASQLAYMIAGPTATAARTFELTEFSDKHPTTNPVTGQLLDPVPFINLSLGFSAPSGQALPTLNLTRVYVITGPDTCSASESIINGLRGVNIEVIQIGSTTCGKPYGFFPADNCGTTYFSIQFQGTNEQGFGDYSDGFSPANSFGPASTFITGCSVADDFDRALGDPTEGRFAAALRHRDFNTCPTPSGLNPAVLSKPQLGLQGDRTDLISPPWRDIRILGGPQ